MLAHRMSRARVVACSMLAAAALAACGSATERMELPVSEKRTAPQGVEAVFAQVQASGMNGSVRFIDRGGVTHALINVGNGPPGPYSIVIHERGNCTSPNAFSAGQAWAPPGWPVPATRVFPEIVLNTNGTGDMTVRLAGLRIAGPDSLEGRAVLVYTGATADADLRPGVRNNVVLCGAVGPVRSFFDFFVN